MQLSTISLAITRLGGLFSPASLFAAGEQGAWYDPADLTTLFQDSAGTTPVTAVEQPVGLMLDKSKGLVLGSEAVVTPLTGSSSGSWAIGPTSITRNSSSTGQANLTLNITPSTNVRYVVSFTVANLSGDTFFYRVGSGGAANQITANGTYTVRVLGGGGSASLIFAPWTGAAGEATITNISVRELPGNHAFQTTSAKRPVLSGRVNLLTKTEQFDDAVWGKSAATVTANAAFAPDGTTTADRLTDNTSSTEHRVAISLTVPVGAYTWSVYAKAETLSWLHIGVPNSVGSRVDTYFDVGNGAVGTVPSGFTAQIQSVGSGWYRCTVSGSTQASTYIVIATSTANNVQGYAGTGQSLLIWGADLRPADQATGLLPAYQRVNTATDYDTAGFPLYLKFDGMDDAMTTNSVDFSAGDKMTVFAGVRKLSDAAAILAELSVQIAINNGTFYLVSGADPSPSDRYSSASRGTSTLTTAFAATTTVGNAPDTAVLSSTHNISGDLSTIRRNSIAGTSAIADQGSGNFGDYPLFIGARNQASSYLNGHIYGMVIRGAASTSEQISATENWLNQRTAAY
jgi:hypothetical protein